MNYAKIIADFVPKDMREKIANIILTGYATVESVNHELTAVREQLRENNDLVLAMREQLNSIHSHIQSAAHAASLDEPVIEVVTPATDENHNGTLDRTEI